MSTINYAVCLVLRYWTLMYKMLLTLVFMLLLNYFLCLFVSSKIFAVVLV